MDLDAPIDFWPVAVLDDAPIPYALTPLGMGAEHQGAHKVRTWCWDCAQYTFRTTEGHIICPGCGVKLRGVASIT